MQANSATQEPPPAQGPQATAGGGAPNTPGVGPMGGNNPPGGGNNPPGNGNPSSPSGMDPAPGPNEGSGMMEQATESDPFKTARWSMMGYDARNHYHNPMEQSLSVENAGQLEVKWTFEVGGYPPGTPVIADGKVFVLATGGLYALDFLTGKEIWHNADLTGTSSVAYDDGALYVHTTPGAEVYKVDPADGKPLWGPVKSYARAGADGTSSPIVANGKVFVGHSTSLEIIDAQGAQREAQGGVAAFNISDGTEAWHYITTTLPENGAMVWSTVAADDTAVYASTGNNYTMAGPNSDAIHAIADMDGSRLWANQVRQGDIWVLTNPLLIANPDTDFGANPILAEVGGKQVVAAGDKAGDFWVMDRADGSMVWSRTGLSGSSSQATGGVLNSGAFDGNAFYAVANEPPLNSVLVAMNAADGKDLWPPKRFTAITFGIPSLANGVLAVPINEQLHVLNAATGESLKMFTTGGTIAAGAPAIAGGRIVVASGLRYELQASAINNNEIICYGLPGDEDKAVAGSSEGTTDPGNNPGGDPMAPTWTAIWDNIIVGTGCNGGALCHAGTVGSLTMNDKDEAHAALVGMPAMGTNTSGTNQDCVDSGLTRVVAGDPANSLLMQKLDGMQTCGVQMPPGALLEEAQRNQIRTWIMNGAAND